MVISDAIIWVMYYKHITIVNDDVIICSLYYKHITIVNEIHK
jgi:hypothetical protein